VTDGKTTYVTNLRNKETLPMFFFWRKFATWWQKKISQNFIYSVNWKNIWIYANVSKLYKIEKKS
jgi:hypothetical protein